MVLAGTVRYGAGVEDGPPELHGRFDLTLAADGAATLEHRERGVRRVWSARVEPLVCDRLAEELDKSGFPDVAVPEVPPGNRIRELTIDGSADTVRMRWSAADNTTLAGAFRLLDALVHQVSDGAFDSTTDRLPWVTHRAETVTAAARPPGPVAALGGGDGRQLAAHVRPDGAVVVSAMPGGEPLATIPPAAAPTRSLALGVVDGVECLFVAGDEGLIRRWRVAGGELLAEQAGHAGAVRAVAGVPGEGPFPTIWSADSHGRALHWPADGGAPAAWPPHPAGVTAITRVDSGAGDVLVTGADDGVVRLRSAADPETIYPREGADGWVDAVCATWLGGELVIASGGADGTIRISSGSGADEGPLLGHAGPVTGLAYGLLGGRLVLGSCGLDGTVRTWDVVARRELAAWPAGDDWPSSLAAVAVGEDLVWAVGGSSGTVDLWRAADGVSVRRLVVDGWSTPVLALAAVSDAGRTLIAAGHQHGALRLWDAVTGDRVAEETARPQSLLSMSAVGAGRLVVGVADGSIRVYEVPSARLLQVRTPHTDQVTHLRLTTVYGAPVLVSTSSDRTVRFWDPLTLRPLRQFFGHEDIVTVAEVAEFGGRATVISSGCDRTVRLWDARTGAQLSYRWGHPNPVYQLAVGGVGGRMMIASGGYSEPVLLWDSDTDRPIGQTAQLPGLVRAMLIGTVDGEDSLVVYSSDGVRRRWRLPDLTARDEQSLPEPAFAAALGADGAVTLAGANGAFGR